MQWLNNGANNSNFILKNIIVNGYKVLTSGTLIIINDDEVIFNFEDFEEMPIKIIFKNTWCKKKSHVKLKDQNLILYNMNSSLNTSTTEYFLISSWIKNNKVCEKLYITFSVSGQDIKTFHYTFFTKEFNNGN